MSAREYYAGATNTQVCDFIFLYAIFGPDDPIDFKITNHSCRMLTYTHHQQHIQRHRAPSLQQEVITNRIIINRTTLLNIRLLRHSHNTNSIHNTNNLRISRTHNSNKGNNQYMCSNNLRKGGTRTVWPLV